MEASMNKNLRRITILTVLALVVLAAPVAFTARAHDDDSTTFHARLTGFGEVPPKLVDGKGRFTGKLSADGNSISWTLTWSGLTGPAQAAHIHFGQPQNVGAVVLFFFRGGGRPAGASAAGPRGVATRRWGTCG